MNTSYYPIAIVFVFLFITAGVASAGSSVGSGTGLSSLPTTFEWEGDTLLNGQDASDMFDDSMSDIFDDPDAVGMVLYSTGAAVNNTTQTNLSVNSTAPGQKKSDDALSGYASVGEIIKAQDWAALQKYTAGINATSEIPDSDLSLENRNNNWDSLFKEPQVISCGGCS